ncbi:MAG: penicillin-binding protein [Paludibacteraceae bacterium]
MPLIKKPIVFRLAIVYLVLAVCFLSVVVKMFVIQTVQRDELLELDKQNPNKEIVATRGNIYSCDGKLLASTVPSYRVYMDTQTEYLKAKNGQNLKRDIDSLAWCLSHKFGDRSPAEYKRMILQAHSGKDAKARRLPLYPHQISYSDLKELQTFPLFRKGQMRGGLISEKYVRRIKPFGSLASRTIGSIYGHAEKGGASGLELAYDSVLRGRAGLGQYQHLGSYATYVPIIEPEDGLDITTTIDIEIQDIAESVFVEYLKRFSAEQGCVAVMEVATGELKACVNMNRVSPGVYAETDDMLFYSRSEPGSTFKTMAMMVALENGLVKPDDKINTGNGEWMMYGRKMTDSHENGVLTMTEVFAKSSNIGMSRVIDDYYKDKPGDFVDALYKMGVGKPLDLDLVKTPVPDVRHPNDAGVRWSKTTLPWMSIGYETGMPPIYTLAFYNAIANNGRYVRPMLVKSIGQNGRVFETFKTQTVNSKICSSQTLRDIRMMLRAVVTDGTGRRANSSFVTLAGKTGTAQIDYWKNVPVRHQITFCGYFPADQPLYSIIVVMRKPVEPADAGTMCGPVARQIAERIYSQTARQHLTTTVPCSAVPTVKYGMTASAMEALDELDVDWEGGSTVWSKTGGTQQLMLSPLAVPEQIVPNVVGMGAKDAVYLMEKAGLYVQLYGRGCVVQQSIAAGTNARRGQTVILELR